ncbi:MAG: metallophosphoesterase family protein, partial [Gammaproteobacteria bacterium]|nr:metallophosphoesterase family protein [Gammaproteobacteria bacterium]
MTTRIGLISDVHASPVPLQQALEIFAQQNVSDIICAGDIAGYFDSLEQTIDLLERYNCKTIIGNHDQSFVESCKENEDSSQLQFLQALPETLTFEIENKSIYVVDASPPSSQHGGIKLLDQNGDLIEQQKKLWEENLQGFNHDVLIVGHTHQVYAEQLGKVLVVNPGSCQFNHSCMILTLPDLTVQTYALENRAIDKSWNFSKLYRGNNRYPS